MSEHAIEVRDLTKVFGGNRLLFGGRRHKVVAVDAVTLALHKGETLAVVGESGSGKSTLARMLVGLEQPTYGNMKIAGQDASTLRRQGAGAVSKAVQYVFQDPVASLNPHKTIGQILETPLKLLNGYDAVHRRARMAELLDAVQMPADTLTRYPHEFSGGQAQRIAIARALAAEAEVLILDEPVSALDVSVQAQVLLLLQELKQTFGLSYLFISHDLAVVEAIADQVAVMCSGRVVEQGPVEALFGSPQDPYTRQLIGSAPRMRRTGP